MSLRNCVAAFLAAAAVSWISTPCSAQATRPTTSFTADLGYVSASGNTALTTLSLGDKLVHTRGKLALSQIGAYVYGETAGNATANQLRLAGRADFDFQPRIGVFGGVAYERNTFAGFDSRTDEIAGLRWKAIVAPSDSLSLDGGGGLTQQSNVDGTSDSYPSARTAANYKHVFGKASYFQQIAEYVPNLKTSGAFRANSESALTAPISIHIGIKTSYSVRYDSRPPVGFGTTDRVLTMGLQLSF